MLAMVSNGLVTLHWMDSQGIYIYNYNYQRSIVKGQIQGQIY